MYQTFGFFAHQWLHQTTVNGILKAVYLTVGFPMHISILYYLV